MNAAVLMQTCPSEETLAAFIDGKLEGSLRLEVVQHLVDCGDCRDIVVAADEYSSTQQAESSSTQQAAQNDKVVPGPFGMRWLAPLAAAAAVVAVLLGVPAIRERIFGRDDGMGELVAVANGLPKRMTEARLSADFAYRPYSITRGESESEILLELAASERSARVAENQTASNLHEFGVASILNKKVKDAVPALERAAQLSPSADVLNDLAAAYIARGDYEPAYEAATKAWAIEQTPAVAWNIALALERLDRNSEAIVAWKKYLEIDSNSKWSEEAKGNLLDAQEEEKFKRQKDGKGR